MNTVEMDLMVKAVWERSSCSSTYLSALAGGVSLPPMRTWRCDMRSPRATLGNVANEQRVHGNTWAPLRKFLPRRPSASCARSVALGHTCARSRATVSGRGGAVLLKKSFYQRDYFRVFRQYICSFVDFSISAAMAW